MKKVTELKIINHSARPLSFKEKYSDLSGCIFEGDLDIDGVGINSLEGCPDIVTGVFSCAENYLISLIGGPSEVGDYFSCANNKLTNLIGGPATIGSSANGLHFFYDCSNNNLESLKGCPKRLSGVAASFSFIGNKLEEEDFLKFICKGRRIRVDTNNVEVDFSKEFVLWAFKMRERTNGNYEKLLRVYKLLR